jgi:hypothetical protein
MINAIYTAANAQRCARVATHLGPISLTGVSPATIPEMYLDRSQLALLRHSRHIAVRAWGLDLCWTARGLIARP